MSDELPVHPWCQKCGSYLIDGKCEPCDELDPTQRMRKAVEQCNEREYEKAASELAAPSGYAACPHCGCQGEPVTSHIGNHENKTWWIQCPACESRGPASYSVAEATYKWSLRHNDMRQPPRT